MGGASKSTQLWETSTYFSYSKETAAQAVVVCISWAFRKIEKPRSREDECPKVRASSRKPPNSLYSVRSLFDSYPRPHQQWMVIPHPCSLFEWRLMTTRWPHDDHDSYGAHTMLSLIHHNYSSFAHRPGHAETKDRLGARFWALVTLYRERQLRFYGHVARLRRIPPIELLLSRSEIRDA